MHARAFPGVELRQPFNSKTERICWHKALRAAPAGNTLGPEEAKVLIYARETGAVDNTACRDFSGLDTLAGIPMRITLAKT